MSDSVLLDLSTAPGVATIRLDRPKVNAITDEMLGDLLTICSQLETRTETRAVVLTGGERNFAAGADISEFTDFDDAAALRFSRRFNDAALAIEGLPQITVAAVNGFALGGGFELALATDFRLAATDARFGLPEILLGVIPGGGGTQRLSRLAGITLAKELVYSGRHLDAAEALAHQVVSAVHEPGALQAAAVEMASSFAEAPASVHIAKRVMLEGYHLPLEEAAAIEAAGFAAAFATDDATIGIESFMEHGPGKAVFTGR